MRRAIGATPFDVAVQLFMEAMSFAALGVLAGVSVGMLGAFVWQILWGSSVANDGRLLLLTATSSVAVNGLACLVPALMAGRVEPAAALRL